MMIYKICDLNDCKSFISRMIKQLIVISSFVDTSQHEIRQRIYRIVHWKIFRRFGWATVEPSNSFMRIPWPQAILRHRRLYPMTTWANNNAARGRHNAQKIQIFWTGAISRGNASLCIATRHARGAKDLLAVIIFLSNTCIQQLRNHVSSNSSFFLRIIRYYRGITRLMWCEKLLLYIRSHHVSKLESITCPYYVSSEKENRKFFKIYKHIYIKYSYISLWYFRFKCISKIILLNYFS